MSEEPKTPAQLAEREAFLRTEADASVAGRGVLTVKTSSPARDWGLRVEAPETALASASKVRTPYAPTPWEGQVYERDFTDDGKFK